MEAVLAVVGEEPVGHARGAGRSKKEAEQDAAQKTLALLLPMEQKGVEPEEDT